eukprot:Sdes_comp10680_c0_seq1m2373
MEFEKEISNEILRIRHESTRSNPQPDTDSHEKYEEGEVKKHDKRASLERKRPREEDFREVEKDGGKYSKREKYETQRDGGNYHSSRNREENSKYSKQDSKRDQRKPSREESRSDRYDPRRSDRYEGRRSDRYEDGNYSRRKSEKREKDEEKPETNQDHKKRKHQESSTHQPNETANKTSDENLEFASSLNESESSRMQKILGFSQFSSTKGTKVIGTDVSAVNLVQQRKFRQYMNRRGGFNRPLQS